jgi:hypothetical protein
MSESQRGCGYRKIGGLYLVSDPGIHLNCDGLPLPLEPCGCCGFKPPFSRNLQRIQFEYIIQAEKKKHTANEDKACEKAGVENIFEENVLAPCSCPDGCPICHAEVSRAAGIQFGLMFVGSQNYTPESFIKEAFSMGVSKRIPEIPSWLKLNETWIFLAHQKTPKENLQGNGMHMKEPELAPAIFYGFKPQRCEMPVWKGDLTDEQILKLESQGITPVILDKTAENMKKHKYGKDLGRNMKKLLEEKL